MQIRNDITVNKNKRSKTKPWFVRWWSKYDPTIGKQRRFSKSFRTRKLAERFAEQLKQDIADGIEYKDTQLTLEILCDKFLKARKNSLAYSTYEIYEDTIGRLKEYFSPFIQLRRIKKEDAQAFVSNIRLIKVNKPASGSTISKQGGKAPMLPQQFCRQISLCFRARCFQYIFALLRVDEKGG